LPEGLFCTSEVDSFAVRDRQRVFHQLQEIAGITRTWGDCYGYVLVATGRAELMLDPELCLWDTAALHPVIEEAGGTFTDWQGRSTVYGGEGMATNGHTLDEVLAITRGT
jgi:fructose-1,6-bisphosphatase/inositol monophosphatase family enzyme